MTFLDFIGFLVAVVAFLFLMWKQVKEQRRRQENPEEYEAEIQKQEAELRKLFGVVDVEVEGGAAIPASSPRFQKN